MSAALSDRLRDAFVSAFGGSPDFVVRAPGRVNLIGEHTDYNDGFALPCAIGAETRVAVRARRDGIVRVVAADFDGREDAFRAGTEIEPSARYPWANYGRGVVREMARAGYPCAGMDAAIAGNIPQGSGLSSSASLEIALALAIATLAGRADAGRRALALIAQRAENDFVGCKCGVLDQLASACGEAGAALLIDCRSLALRLATVPAEAAILIVHSGVARSLVDGRYNARRAECERAAHALGVKALRDIDEKSLMAMAHELDPVAHRRARHVVSENRRTLAAADALVQGDLAGFGQLMAQSHASMRDDFEITTPEIDHLVDLLQKAIGGEGGARMTGGGFGGCVVAIMRASAASEIAVTIARNYRRPDGAAPLVLLERPAQGASIVAGHDA